MENLIWGIVTIVVCLVIYWFAFLSYRKLNFSKTLLLILTAGLLLRIYVSSDQYLHKWDERYHALVAKNFLKHPLKPTLYDTPVFPVTPENWGANHVWLEKGPIPLWAIAISLKLFGMNEFVVRIPSIILSLLAVYLTFLIGIEMFDKRVALLAAFLHSINGMAIELVGGRISSDHVETFFIFFIELAIYFAVCRIKYKKNNFLPVLIGFSAGLAFLSKWSPALIVFAAYLIGMLVSDKFKLRDVIIDLSFSIASFLFTVLPWILYIHFWFPEEFSWVLKKFLFALYQPVDGHQGPWYFYIHYIGITFGELIYLPLLLSVIKMIKGKPDWRMFLLTVWWLIPVIIFSLAVSKRLTYLMLSAPAFILVLSYYWMYFFDRRKKFRYPWLVYLLLIGLLASPVNFCITRTKVFNIREFSPAWAVELKKIAWKYNPSEKIVLFNIDHNIEAMYYTGLTVYNFLPTQSDADRITRMGYRVIINQNEKAVEKNPLKNVEYYSLTGQSHK